MPPTTLLPPALELSLTADELPSAAANLMPFSVDYDGFAPIDSFMLLRPAPSSGVAEPTPGFISAFRGRTIQSTALPLPPGYQAHIVQLSQVGSSTPTNDIIEPAPKAHYRPAKQQKFSMDSDEEDGDDDDADEQEERASPDTQMAEVTPRPKVGHQTVIRRKAAVANSDVRVWGADGPIDTGDDPYFRTVEEWMTVIGPLVSKSDMIHSRNTLNSFAATFLEQDYRGTASPLSSHVLR